MKNNISNFNASQREAICHGDGPALVLAGPGSGKTTVITKRLEYMTGVLKIPPEDITVVTFTKAAAMEMQRRFESLTGARLPVRFGTFHAIFYRILRENPGDIPLTIIKEKEKLQLIRHVLNRGQICAELGPAFLEVIGRLKNGEGLPERSPIETVSCEQILEVADRYRKLCRERGRLDFDDMAWECLQLFEKRPDILRKWQKRCRYILADEYQDVAPIQERILFLLALPENNLFLVGDDDQSVYGFRGAGTESMLSFPEKYPDTRQILLEKNYRCRPGIIQAAGAVISENKERFVKKQIPHRESSGEEEVVCQGFPDRNTEYRAILKALRDLKRQGKLSRTAVLFRKHADSVALTGLLARHRIPFIRAEKAKIGYDHFVAEDVTAYLRLLHGDRSRKNFYRIMNRPMRGIEREACGGENFDFQELLRYHGFATEIADRIRKLEKDCRRASGMDFYAAVTYIRKGMGYESWLQKEYGGAALEESLRMLRSLQALAKRTETMAQWEKYMETGDGADKEEKEDEEDGVRILTYHGSKGLEFDHVFMPDLNEGTVPHKKALSEKETEEERRMFYVGMTRARERLYLFFRTGTKKESETMSRFLHVLIPPG